MAKAKTVYVCQHCGAIAPRWEGKCSDCGEWNTIVEESRVEAGGKGHGATRAAAVPVPITAKDSEPPSRLPTGLAECDRVLGGGIVPGSLVLVGGDPGIGKSTLMLQAASHIAKASGPVLYISGEESFDQARMRAKRLNALHDRLLMLTETDMATVLDRIASANYACVMVDSIQSMHNDALGSAAGSVGQVRECANEFLRAAKGRDVPIFLVGHVTKDGSIAGPRVLEHLVDTVLYFEGEGKHALRILRGVKNRFGSTNEIGVFEMTDAGLKEVESPSELFLRERPESASGSAVIPSVEGTRPLLVEVQALVTESHLATPRRTVTGVNSNRVALILAVLEKRGGLLFSDKDVYVNVAGGVRLDEPAADLAVALALASSLLDRAIPRDVAVFGEIGLAGEIRAVDHARMRTAEASKFGFQTCILPAGSALDIDTSAIRVVPVRQIREAVDAAID
ncbi:MAG: DNA repair protein RadA [Candidatus Hydrogenedentota bacterium]